MEVKNMIRQSIIYSGIPTPPRKHVLVITHDPVQKNPMKNPTIYYKSSMMTENIKVNNPHSYTTSNLKDNYALPSYQDISSRVSTIIYTNFQVTKIYHNNFWKVWERTKDGYSRQKEIKEFKQLRLKMKHGIIYLRK